MRCDGLVRGSFFLRSRRSAWLSRALYSSSILRSGFSRSPLPSSEEQPSPMERRFGQAFSKSYTLPRLGTEKERIHTPRPVKNKAHGSKRTSEASERRLPAVYYAIFLCVTSSWGRPCTVRITAAKINTHTGICAAVSVTEHTC